MANKKSEEARKREADAILRRVEQDSETVGRSNLAHRAESFLGIHDKGDPAEKWGKILGRSLGVLFLIYLVWHLLSTYVLAPTGAGQ